MGMRLFIISIVALILFVFYLTYRDYKDHIERGCVAYDTGQTQTSWQYVYDSKGNIVSMYPVTSKVYSWNCPDGKP